MGRGTVSLHIHIKEQVDALGSSFRIHVHRFHNTEKSAPIAIEADEINLGKLRIKDAIFTNIIGFNISKKSESG